MTQREKDIIEVAWVHEWLVMSNSYHKEVSDRNDAKKEIMNIVKIFEQEHKDTDWADLDYYEELQDRATELLLAWNATGFFHIPNGIEEV